MLDATESTRPYARVLDPRHAREASERYPHFADPTPDVTELTRRLLGLMYPRRAQEV